MTTTDIPPLQHRIDALLLELIEAQWIEDDAEEDRIKKELTTLLDKQSAGEMWDPAF